MQHCTLNQISILDDIEFLYKAMTSADQYLYSTRLKFCCIQEFEQWLVHKLKNEFHDFYIVKETEKNIKVGYVHNYDFSLKHGHCKLVTYICPTYRNTGIGAFASVYFLAKLFKTYPLRKVYSTIYEYNTESLKSNLEAGFVEEGVLKNYRYHDGKIHSIYYLSLNRQEFENKMIRLVK